MRHIAIFLIKHQFKRVDADPTVKLASNLGVVGHLPVTKFLVQGTAGVVCVGGVGDEGMIADGFALRYEVVHES